MMGTPSNTTNSPTTTRNWKQLGEETWKRLDKVNGELFALTYGCLVAQIFRDNHQNGPQTNAQLERLGYSIGTRLIDDLLSRLPPGTLRRCVDFKETAEMIKLAFRIYLNVPTTSTAFSDDQTMTVTIPLGSGSGSSLLAASGTTSTAAANGESVAPGGDGLGGEWVALPEEALLSGLHYGNMLVGVIRGALEMVNVQVDCSIVKDPFLLPSLSATEISVKFVKFIDEELPFLEDD